MGLSEAIFIIQLVVVVGGFFFKFYNVMSGGQAYEIKISFMVWIGIILSYGIGLIVTLLGIDELLLYKIFSFEVLLLLLSSLFMAIEIILYIGRKAVNSSGYRNGRNSRESYNAKE